MNVTYEVTATLTAAMSSHAPVILVYDSYRRHNYEEMGDICQTVSAFYGTGGGNVPIVVKYDNVHREEILQVD